MTSISGLSVGADLDDAFRAPFDGSRIASTPCDLPVNGDIVRSDIVRAISPDTAYVWRGYRLIRLEVRNFGGYHGRTTVFDLGGMGAILAGENGAGKSTALDALKVLLVDGARFNDAGTTVARDRSVDSYYRGVYAKAEKVAGRRADRTLRQYNDPDRFMAVLGVFATARGEVLSLARLLMMRDAGKLDWRNMIAQQELSLDRDFPKWTSEGPMARLMTARQGRLHKTQKAYFGDLYQSFGVGGDDDQGASAFSLFEKGMAIKELHSTTDFARSMILPLSDFRQMVDGAIVGIDATGESVRELRRLKEKLASLKATVATFDRLEAESLRVAGAQETKDRLEQAILVYKAHKARGDRKRIAARLEAEVAAMDAAAALRARLERDIARLDAQLHESGADRLEKVRSDLVKVRSLISARNNNIEKLLVAARAANVSASAESAAHLRKTRDGLDAMAAKATVEIAALDAQRADAEKDLWRAKEDRTGVAGDLAALNRTNSAMPPKLQEARDAIAAAVGLDPEDMPLLGEMVRVNPNEAAWEGAANRVLDGLARQILVGTESFRDAKRVLDEKHWGVRVVLKEIDIADSAHALRAASGSLAAKLEIKGGHPFSRAVEAMVARTAQHACLGREEMACAKSHAVTVSGTVIESGRAEKNDAHRIDDRRTYVLGWSVEDRRRLLTEDLARCDAAIAKASSFASQIAGGLEVWRRRQAAAEHALGSFPDWDDIDTSAQHEERICLEEELARLESGALRDLIAERDRARREEKAAEAAHGAAREATGRTKGTLEAIESDIQRARASMKTSIAAHGRMTAANRSAVRSAVRQALIVATPGAASTTASTTTNAAATNAAALDTFRLVSGWRELDEAFARIRDVAGRTLDNRRKQISAANIQAQTQVSRHFTSFADDLAKLSDRIQSDTQGGAAQRQEWRELLSHITYNDLPSLEKDFQSRRLASASDGLRNIRMAIETYREKIDKMAKGLNAVLGDVIYTPGVRSRARIRVTPTSDREIIMFDRAVREALSGVTHLADDKIYDQSQRLVEMVRENDTTERVRLRAKLLDLRNWFDVDVEEYLPAAVETDPAAQEVQINVFDGKDGKSGGEKERLAMLIAGAGLAYVFGAQDNTRPDIGLNLICIDEAFLRSSDDTALAATEILSALGLQVIGATPFSKIASLKPHTAQVCVISSLEGQTSMQSIRF